MIDVPDRIISFSSLGRKVIDLFQLKGLEAERTKQLLTVKIINWGEISEIHQVQQ